MRALPAVEHYGQRVTGVTVWPDSKIVVDGCSKGVVHTLQSMLVANREELWDEVQALRDRGVMVHIKTAKAHRRV
eukprot:3410781-Karenia_brevis.AAC.1